MAKTKKLEENGLTSKTEFTVAQMIEEGREEYPNGRDPMDYIEMEREDKGPGTIPFSTLYNPIG